MISRFDIGNLRLAPEMLTAAEPRVAKPRRTKKQGFTMFPHAWLERLKGARLIASYRVSAYVLHRDWKDPGRPVTLSNVASAEIGVSRWMKWRALDELERLGLVSVERRGRRSPLVRPKHAA